MSARTGTQGRARRCHVHSGKNNSGSSGRGGGGEDVGQAEHPGGVMERPHDSSSRRYNSPSTGRLRLRGLSSSPVLAMGVGEYRAAAGMWGGRIRWPRCRRGSPARSSTRDTASTSHDGRHGERSARATAAPQIDIRKAAWKFKAVVKSVHSRSRSRFRRVPPG